MNFQKFNRAFFLILAAAILSACGSAIPPSETTPAVTPSPTIAPLGDPSNPLTLLVANPANLPAAEEAANRLSSQFLEETGFALEVRFVPTAQELLLVVSKGQAQAAFLPPATYLYASERGLAEVQLLANVFGSYYYGSQVFINTSANPEVPIPADPLDENSALAALSLMNGKTPCFTTPTSLSGYIVPLGAFRRYEMELAEPVFSQSFEAVIRSLYIRGICDLGATYAVSGDPRTAAELQDLPDILQTIQPVWKSAPIIPSLSFSTLPGVDKDIRESITAFLLQWIADPLGKETISALTGTQVQDFRRVDDSVFDPLRQAIRDSGIPLEQLVGY